jgi:hypothetical protein
MLLLVPSDPLSPRRPDEHFRPEAQAARAAGVEVALVDHDALTRPGEAAAAVRRVPAADDAVYRGWMLRGEQYDAFAAALAARGARLRTAAAQYRRAHELPGWYAALRAVTPESRWTVGADLAAFDACCAALGAGAAVLRDYSKSLKHSWAEAAYIPDVTDRAAARAVATRFLDLRGEDLVGGLVVRRFEELAPVEARTWWTYGRCALVTAHPDTADRSLPGAPDLTAVEPVVAALDLPFVTVDLALRADGTWRVVELGDGQVSDRPSTTPPDDLISLLTAPEPR